MKITRRETRSNPVPQTCYQFCSGVRKPLDPPNIPIIFLCVFLQDPIEFVWVFFGWRKNGVLFLSGMSKAIVLTDFPGYLRGRTTKRCRKTSSLGGPTRDRDHGFKPLRNDPSGGHRSSGSPPSGFHNGSSFFKYTEDRTSSGRGFGFWLAVPL